MKRLKKLIKKIYLRLGLREQEILPPYLLMGRNELRRNPLLMVKITNVRETLYGLGKPRKKEDPISNLDVNAARSIGGGPSTQ